MPVEPPKTEHPTVTEVYEQYIKDNTLRKGAARLFAVANKYKMRNRRISYHSFTFTYRGHNVFNITMRATISNKGVRKIDPTNHLIVQLSMGRTHEAAHLLLAQPEAMRLEYIDGKIISCGVCAGTPEGQAIRQLTCDKTLRWTESGKTHYLCTINFGYARHNPTPEQFEMIEAFIMARIAAIDAGKAKKLL